MKYLLYLLGVLALLISCSSNDTGPVEVKWDRDSCERCRMVLSDRHFAAQVRGGPKNKAYLFDDLGCAVHWLKKQPWGEDETTQIWVTDYRNGNWLNARTAYYVGGQITPMDFDFGAVPESVEGSVDFDTAKTQMLKKKKKPRHEHSLP
jgi:nitrous oxide reductase accessory protein NosL